MNVNVVTQLENWEARRAGGLPDFLIIGTQKGGTTSLYRYLLKHPNVLPPVKKEVHYFDIRFHKPIEWYRSFFPDLTQSPTTGSNGKPLLTCEATPYYLFHPQVPKRMAAVLPDAKLIVILRNPVDRAYSNYRMEVDMGHETLPFDEAIEAEVSRIGSDTERMITDEKHRSDRHIWYSYLARGIYVDQLLRWDGFFPRSQMLVLGTEELRDDRRVTVDKVLNFLGLSSCELDMTELAHSRQYPPLDPALRERLVEYFQPHNRRLYDYLGVDFQWR